MTRSSRPRVAAGLAVLAVVVGLTACGSPSPSSPNGRSAATTSPPPSAADTSICQLVAKATTAYNAKDYGSWRSYMEQVATSADSAQYVPVKKYAEEVKGGERVERTTTTTTTKSKSKSKAKTKGTANVGGLAGVFGILGGYVGLQRACAHLSSPGSTSSGQGAPAQHGQSSVRGTGGHPPTQKGKSRGKVTVGF